MTGNFADMGITEEVQARNIVVTGSFLRVVRWPTMKHDYATRRALQHGRRPAGRRPVWLGSKA